MVGLSLVTVITASVVALPGPVAADQVSDLRAQAAQIANDLVLEQLQIGTYQQQYDVDVAKVQRDQAQIASSEAQIQADIIRVSRDHHRLQTEAVWAYINLDPKLSGTQALFEPNQNQNRTLARAQYEDVAGGDITLTIDALHIDETRLRAERATLEGQEAQDQATTNQETRLSNAAHQTEVQLESKQSEITGKLAVAVAQQQAAQAAAAAAAVRAAQAAAVAAVATSTTSPPTSRTTQAAPAPQPAAPAPQAAAPAPQPAAPAPQPAPPAPPAPQGGAASASSGDPSLPPFLQCVLQAESGGNYGAVSPGGTYMGGFQFSQSTWNEAASLAGMPQLINVPPNQASPAEQDDLAIALYGADGQQSWNDRCRTN
jgi:hypothetical protein